MQCPVVPSGRPDASGLADKGVPGLAAGLYDVLGAGEAAAIFGENSRVMGILIWYVSLIRIAKRDVELFHPADYYRGLQFFGS